MPAGRPTDYRAEFCDQVEADMAAGYSLTAFAGLIGQSRSVLNVWMDAHPEFLEAVSRGKAKRLRHWETSGMRVAERGGGPGTATIIVFGLKNMGGDEWADKSEVKNTGDPANPVVNRNVFEFVIVDPNPDSEGVQAPSEAGKI